MAWTWVWGGGGLLTSVVLGVCAAVTATVSVCSATNRRVPVLQGATPPRASKPLGAR